ncbi:Uncharacterised protein [Segatella copri]|nr:Uncharacterised protein [Segatella copri]
MFTLLVISCCLARKGARSSYFTQKSGYLFPTSPKSSLRVIIGHKANTLVWKEAVFWS